MIKLNQNADIAYLYYRFYCKDFDFNRIITKSYVTIKRGKYTKSYYKIYCGFDIETYTDIKTTYGFMYIWSFSIGKYVIYGRKWSEFVDFINNLADYMKTKELNKYIIVWIANLGYEFQFMRKYFNVVDSFSKEKRKPLYITLDNNIEFRECLTISGGGLNYLSKTYTNTKKCVGDLDYLKPRNFLTELTEEETGYTDNDVLILSEWSRYIFDTFMVNNFLPLTRTQIIIKEMNEKGYELYGSKKGYKKYISSLYPNEKDYKFFMKYLFRGGYCHGNIVHIGDILEKVYSFDFTSSYPSVMMKRYFPLFFKKVEPIKENIEKYRNDCFIILVDFHNIRNKTAISIESKHKCIKLKNPVIDNGRILKAEYMRVCLTEIDYFLYEMFYEWDNIDILYMSTAKKIKMFKNIKDTIKHWYTEKALLKMNNKPYNVEKENVNIIYGASVKRFSEGVIEYKNNEWCMSEDSLDYIKQTMNSPMSCYFGIYITAQARYNLLSTVYKMECSTPNSTLYEDTDSVKFIDDKNLKFIKEYNKNEMLKNLKMCLEEDISFSIYGDLGLFDNEGIIKLKYLGAKRYVYEKNGIIKSTIAGLPKNALIDYCKKMNYNVFDFFSNNMFIKNSEKNTSYYHDNETELSYSDYQGNYATMSEKSSIGLCETSFNLNINELWLELIYNETLKNEVVEKR